MCQAFNICVQAALAYKMALQAEEYLTKKNIESLKKAKAEIEALFCQQGGKR